MPRMSWPSWRRIRTVTRAAGMATGAGGARHCWSRGAVSRRREARTGQPGAEQQGCRSARNSRGARPPGGRSWTVRQVLRLSSPVLGAATNAQGQGAVVARSEHLARRGSSWSAPGRDGRGARSTGTRSVAAQQGQAHRSAGAQQLGRHGRTHGGQAWRGLSGGSVVLDERAGAAGRLAEVGGAWRPGGCRWRAGGERPWAAARLLQPKVGATDGDAVRAPAAGLGTGGCGGEEGAARPRRGKELGASQQRGARQGPSWKKHRPGARCAQERWREER